ncbi:hypothetical protein GYMLUDRAFT_65116 [Collybiopsis luxurians FD-317 M1]|uniref:Uncharacterized protein n=1 Tax=Collybiopsis luxurians FD-317 M1 TaxID=944289 RepID=A0A0D0B9F5_9AGAR|nr:hypothetical protein GYMLUDRAFT_65116 [Collybiopsis luxurians FD-317 M1]
MNFRTTAQDQCLTIEQEIVRLESQIVVQTQKLAMARCNNTKQIERSITTRQEKVETLKKELLLKKQHSVEESQSVGGVNPEATRSTEPLSAVRGSSELTDIDGSGDKMFSDTDLATPLKGKKEQKQPLSVSSAMRENVFAGSPTDVDLRMTPVLAIGNSEFNKTVIASGSVESHPARPTSRSLTEIGERVGEILDNAMGRHLTPSPSTAISVEGPTGYSGTGLSAEARSLMLGWRYHRYWRDHCSTNSTSDDNLKSGIDPVQSKSFPALTSTVDGTVVAPHSSGAEVLSQPKLTVHRAGMKSHTSSLPVESTDVLYPTPIPGFPYLESPASGDSTLTSALETANPVSLHPSNPAAPHEDSFQINSSTENSISIPADSNLSAVSAVTDGPSPEYPTLGPSLSSNPVENSPVLLNPLSMALDSASSPQQEGEGSEVSVVPDGLSSKYPTLHPSLSGNPVWTSPVLLNPPPMTLDSVSSTQQEGSGSLLLPTTPQSLPPSIPAIFDPSTVSAVSNAKVADGSSPEYSTLDPSLPGYPARNASIALNPPSIDLEPASSPQQEGHGSLLLPTALQSLSSVLSGEGVASDKLREMMKTAAQLGLKLINFNGEELECAPDKDDSETLKAEAENSNSRQIPVVHPGVTVAVKQKRGLSFIHISKDLFF